MFYLNYHFGGKSLFVPPELIKGVGSSIHHLIAKFLKFARQDSSLHQVFLPEVLEVKAVAFQLQDLFYHRIFYPYLQEAIASQSHDVLQLNQMWQGITQLIPIWAKLLVKNRPYCTNTALFEKTFVEEELSLEQEFILPDQTKAKITGKFDSLIFDCESKRFCVVEYKTYSPSDTSAQLAQVALYSYMLSSRETLPIDSAVYSLLPEFKAYHYSWEELQNSVYQLIPHKLQAMQEWLAWQPEHPNPPPATVHDHLCDLCPQQQKCQSYFLNTVKGNREQGTGNREEEDNAHQAIGNSQELQSLAFEAEKFPNSEVDCSNVDQPIASIQPDQELPNSEEIAQKLIKVLGAFKVETDYVGSICAPSFIRIKVKPKEGVKVASILKLSQDLQVQLDIAQEPLITHSGGYVCVDLPRNPRVFAALEDYISPEKSDYPSEIKIALGINLEGKLIDANLSDSNTCHFLVGGTTGSGKSEFLKAVITSLIYRYTPEQVKLVLVDPKRISFLGFEKIPYLLHPVIKDNAIAIEVLQELVEEMHRRYLLLEKKGCSSITEYNLLLSKEKKPSIPYIVTVFDEYADLMAEKENKNILETSIKSLGAMARAAGIHLIIATQRPDASVVTPLIRSNLPGRVALRTASEADSKIILGGNITEAFRLLGKGDLFYQTSQALERLQSLSSNSSQNYQQKGQN